MKTALLWVRDNMSVALALVVASALSAGVYQAGEASALDYDFLTKAYKHSPPATMAEIKAAIADGKVTRWEAKKVYQDVMQQSGAVVLGGDNQDLDQARAQLVSTVAGRE